MFKLRDGVIFFAGAEFFHTISHLIIPVFIEMPLKTSIMIVTPEINAVGVVINAAITIALLWWAKKLKLK